MSSFTIQIAIEAGEYVITGSVTSTGDIPVDIFMFENLGTTTLGEYQGVCTFSEYKKLQTFSGTAIPAFGNKYVKATNLRLVLPLTANALSVKAKIINDVKAFKTEFAANAVSTETVAL